MILRRALSEYISFIVYKKINSPDMKNPKSNNFQMMGFVND